MNREWSEAAGERVGVVREGPEERQVCEMTLEERVERLEADNEALRHLVLRLWVAADLTYVGGAHAISQNRKEDDPAVTQLRRRIEREREGGS